MAQQPITSFPFVLVCVAAQEDAEFLRQWEAHLQPLQQAGLISFWSAHHISAGTSFQQEWKHQLNQADLIVLLLSADFFASLDCTEIMNQALERSSRAGTTRVIPVLLRPVAWQESPLATLAPWPSNKVPITQWSNLDAAWNVCIQSLRHLLGRRVPELLPFVHSPTHTDHDWERMLCRLRWSYKEALDSSLHGVAWVELELSTRSDMVSNVINLLFRLPHGDERLLAPGTRVLDVYDEAEGELLILGAPGAGKSTLLLDLAQHLVGRAFADEIHLLPVILRLSSWAIRRPALADWMAEQLNQIYKVHRKLSEHWIQQGRLLPLLDGLDEMEEAARPACIAAINYYHQTHLTPLVICSRQAEYEVVATQERLALQCAIIVQPLSNQQLESSLQSAGASFAGVQHALSQESALRELATTPLMLSVIMLTYRGTMASEIIQQRTNLEQQVWTDYVTRQIRKKDNDTRYPLEQTCAFLSWLALQMRIHQQTIFFAEYLQTDWLALDQQRTATLLTTRLPALLIGSCVSFLFSIFVENTDSIFLLQMGVLGGFVGSCLIPSVTGRNSDGGKRFQARTEHHTRNAVLLGTLFALSFGLYLNSTYTASDWLRDACIFGLGSLLSIWAFQIFLDRLPMHQVFVPPGHLKQRGCLVAWINTMGPPHVWWKAVVLGIGFGLSYGLSYGLGMGLSRGLVFGLGMGLSDGLNDALRVTIIVVLVHRILDVSFKTLRFAERIRWTWYSLFRSEHFWTTVKLTATVSLFTGLSYGPIMGLSFGLTMGLGVGVAAVISGMNIGLSYWLIMGLYQGMKQEHVADQNRSQFNQGIRRSLLNGFLISLISSSIITFINMFSTVWSISLGKVLSVQIAGMVIMWSLSGGPIVLRHYVTRYLLARHRTFPWHAQAFLDDATSRILLRRVGGGYSFIHRRLQDYFADTTVPPSQK